MASEAVLPSGAQPRARLNWKRAWIALALSIVQPWLGHIYNRQPLRAVAYLVFVPTLLLFAHATALCHSFGGLIAFAVIQLGLNLSMVANAFWVWLQDGRTPPLAPVRTEVLVLALLLAVLNFGGAISGFNQDHLLGLSSFVMRSGSMAPTLRDGDRIVADPLAYTRDAPRRGDMVVFVANAPGKSKWIKRVIGLGGDSVVVSEEGVFLNGQLLQEPYSAPSSRQEEPGDNGYGAYRVPDGQHFLMGDNREHSFDSRYPGFGAVDSKRIIGKPLFIYWSTDYPRIQMQLR